VILRREVGGEAHYTASTHAGLEKQLLCHWQNVSAGRKTLGLGRFPRRDLRRFRRPIVGRIFRVRPAMRGRGEFSAGRLFEPTLAESWHVICITIR
jgi:hypothetical protein